MLTCHACVISVVDLVDLCRACGLFNLSFLLSWGYKFDALLSVGCNSGMSEKGKNKISLGLIIVFATINKKGFSMPFLLMN